MRCENEMNAVKMGFDKVTAKCAAIHNKCGEIDHLKVVVQDVKRDLLDRVKTQNELLNNFNDTLGMHENKMSSLDDELKRVPAMLKERDKRFWTLNDTFTDFRAKLQDEYK